MLPIHKVPLDVSQDASDLNILRKKMVIHSVVHLRWNHIYSFQVLVRPKQNQPAANIDLGQRHSISPMCSHPQMPRKMIGIAEYIAATHCYRLQNIQIT